MRFEHNRTVVSALLEGPEEQAIVDDAAAGLDPDGLSRMADGNDVFYVQVPDEIDDLGYLVRRILSLLPRRVSRIVIQEKIRRPAAANHLCRVGPGIGPADRFRFEKQCQAVF